jgi:hypothetical protein
MVDNPTKIYNDYVRANLPNSMSYDTGTDRYDINSHSFFKFKNSNWYFNYISKYGYSAFSAYAVNNFEPALVFDFKGNYFRKSATDSTFGASITHAATTNATMTDGYGPELATNGDFASDSDWTKGTGWSIADGVASSNGVESSSTLSQSVNVEQNKLYEVSFNCFRQSGYVEFNLTGTGVTDISTSITGRSVAYLKAASNVETVQLIAHNFIGSIDNVSVREAPALKWRPHNLLTHSGDLTNANWTNNGLTVTTGQNDFEGNPTAFKVTPTTVSGFHRLYKNQVNSNLVNGILSTVTIDLKADGYNFFSVATNNQHYAVINLSDGSVSLDTNSVSPTVTSLGNGWYRCSITSSTVSQEVFSVGETAQTASFGSQNFTGDGTSGVLVAYPHSFRISLGGMVNNPDASTGRESYLPTTTTPAYAPRRGHHIYNGSAWINEGILHESEARTNLLTSSGDVTGTGWSGGGSTIGAVTAGSPFGTYQTITVSISDSVNSAQRYQIGKSITSGQTYVSSCLLKHSVGTFWAVVDVYDTTSTNKRAWFDLQNGVVGTKDASVLQSGMIDYGDGWWLCWASATVASNSGGFNVELTKGDGILGRTFGDTLLIAGTQFELGATPSSYIPTTTATVTRAAETLTVPAANLPYDNTNMSIQIDGKMTYADTGVGFEVQQYRWQLNPTNYISTNIQTITGRTGQPIFSQRQSTSGLDGVAGTINVYNPDVNVPFNIAARHGSTFVNGAHEGTLLTADTTPTILPDLSATDLLLGNIFMGTIGEFRMWSDDLGDVGITEATLPSTEPSLSLTFDGSENSFIVLDWSE